RCCGSFLFPEVKRRDICWYIWHGNCCQPAWSNDGNATAFRAANDRVGTGTAKENTTMQDMQEPNPSVQSHFPTDDTSAPTVRVPSSGPLGNEDGGDVADRPAIVAVGVAAAQAAGDTLHQQVTTQMGHAAQGIESAASVAEQVKVTLRQGDHETLAQYAEQT